MRAWLGLLFAILITPATWGQPPEYDLLFRGGRVVDGTGNPAFRADVAIQGDRIAAVGWLPEATAKEVIDARNLHIAPGFIDMHSHADRALSAGSKEQRQAPNLVTQGITTVVFGADGRNTTWPLEREIEGFRNPGTALNVIPMVGHGTIRMRVMQGNFRRAATDEEVEQMRQLVRDGMQLGAWGMGAGPEYSPGRYSTTEELVALCHVVAEFNGFYYAHQRSQSRLPRWQLPSMVKGPTLDGIDGLRETITIAEQTGIRAVGTHIKAKGRSSWGRSHLDTRMVDAARKKGAQVYFDHYPYETFNGAAGAIFPDWALQGGRDELRKRLQDPDTRRVLVKDLTHMIDIHGGSGRLIITHHVNQDFIGKTVKQVADGWGKSMEDTLIDFALAGSRILPAGHRVRPMGLSEIDNDQYIRQTYTATCTDAGVSANNEDVPGKHPRFWGAFPRKISRYVKQRGVITLPFAIRSMSSLGAQIIGLTDRGYVLPNYKADLTVFNLEEIADRATVMHPGRQSVGISHVLVNGQFAMKDGELTGSLPGRVLLKSSTSK